MNLYIIRLSYQNACTVIEQINAKGLGRATIITEAVRVDDVTNKAAIEKLVKSFNGEVTEIPQGNDFRKENR